MPAPLPANCACIWVNSPCTVGDRNPVTSQQNAAAQVAKPLVEITRCRCCPAESTQASRAAAVAGQCRAATMCPSTSQKLAEGCGHCVPLLACKIHNAGWLVFLRGMKLSSGCLLTWCALCSSIGSMNRALCIAYPESDHNCGSPEVQVGVCGNHNGIGVRSTDGIFGGLPVKSRVVWSAGQGSNYPACWPEIWLQACSEPGCPVVTNTMYRQVAHTLPLMFMARMCMHDGPV